MQESYLKQKKQIAIVVKKIFKEKGRKVCRLTNHTKQYVVQHTIMHCFFLQD